MEGYLGEFPVDIKAHPEFSEYTKESWILRWIEMFGGIDGSHHKDWLVDQIAQIVTGAEVSVVQGKWDNGFCQYRYYLKSTPAYDAWIETFDGNYDAGSPP